MSIRTFDPATLSQPALHAYLLSAIGPRPIAFASTVDAAGRINLSPFSFFNVFSSNPPIVVFSPARSGRDNSTKDTLDNVLEVPETVINIVNYPLVEQMSLASTAYAKGVNEFEKAGLTAAASEQVRPPRVAEAPVALECIVEEVKALGDGPGAGNLIIARVVCMHIREEYLDADGQLDSSKLDLVARMGGDWYCRATGEALFEIPKPIRTQGIGVDALPLSIRQSTVLTGNNLGRLGNVDRLPTEEELAAVVHWPEVANLLQAEATVVDRLPHLHRLAQRWLNQGDTAAALQLLLWADKHEQREG
jgi:flavin reductase (DIM6/NTAB) family NADH-FMN oxidoreductase RutF